MRKRAYAVVALFVLASEVISAQVAGGPVTAADVAALRAQAEAQDPNACASVFRWTDDPILPGVTAVKADHVIELRRAINEIARGQCPTIHEQVTITDVTSSDEPGGNRDVTGFALNSGTTPIAGDRLVVRVRFLDGSGGVITEASRYLATDGDNCCIRNLEPQQRRPFRVRVQDTAIQDWSYFQVVAFEVDGEPVLCSGCNVRHYREDERGTIENPVFTMYSPPGYGFSEFPTVRGFVQNSGSTRMVGSLRVRVRYLSADGAPIVEASEGLRTDGNNCCVTALDPQQRRPFWVAVINDDVGDWSYFEVVSFENDGRHMACTGCGQRHPR